MQQSLARELLPLVHEKTATFRPRAGERASTMDRKSAALPALLALALIAVPAGQPAVAAQLCGERSEILRKLEQAHAEIPQALGLTTDGAVIEVLVSPKGGWTILATYPKRPTCVIAVGKAWETLPIGGQAA
jgi:hypothetical protein